MRVQGSGAAILVLVAIRSVCATPNVQALDAWTRYLASVEARLDRATFDDPGCDTRSWGETVAVESGTIVDWHGRVCIPGIISMPRGVKRRMLTGGEGEFLSLCEAEARERVERAGLAFKACLGVDPAGFVAPAWLFTSALLPILRENGFVWTEDHRHIYDLQRRETIAAPVITWATRTAAHRYGSIAMAPRLLHRWRDRPILRIAVHPHDLDHPRVVCSTCCAKSWKTDVFSSQSISGPLRAAMTSSPALSTAR